MGRLLSAILQKVRIEPKRAPKASELRGVTSSDRHHLCRRPTGISLVQRQLTRSPSSSAQPQGRHQTDLDCLRASLHLFRSRTNTPNERSNRDARTGSLNTRAVAQIENCPDARQRSWARALCPDVSNSEWTDRHTIHPSTLPPFRPRHVRMHERESALEISGVECRGAPGEAESQCRLWSAF